MNLRLLIAGCLLAALPVLAQTADNGGGGNAPDIKVTTTLHPDGTRTDQQTDFSANTSEAKNYDAAGKLTSRVVYKLNEQGQPLGGSTYNAKGVLVMTATYQRDDAGHVTEETDSTPAGKMIRRIVFRYDASGQLAGSEAFDADGHPIQTGDSSSGKRGRRKSR